MSVTGDKVTAKVTKPDVKGGMVRNASHSTTYHSMYKVQTSVSVSLN